MESIYRWNRWYDGLPDTWRFQTILGPLILIGLINMVLTLADGFPFGLLLLLGIVAVLVMRVPYVVGWLKTAEAGPDGRPATVVEVHGMDWVSDLNRWYDDLPPTRQFLVIPIFLLVVGAINMALTIDHAFPFGLLFLLGVLAVVLLRAPYASGWIKQPPRPAPQGIGGTAPPAAITSDYHHDLLAGSPQGAAVDSQPEARAGDV